MKLLYFTTTNCPACRVMFPRVQRATRKLNIDMSIIDCAKSPALASVYQVRTIPTALLILDHPCPLKLDDEPSVETLVGRLREMIDDCVEGRR